MSVISPRRRSVDEMPQRQHVGAEPQLEVERGHEPARAAHVADATGGGDVLAHRFLNEHRRTRRQAAEDAEDLIARHRDVEHRAADGARIVERARTPYRCRTASP